ncbi:MAG TPA: NADH-quinone oxidoreductase subunit C [Candidatus Binatia bacterium]|nr:NADH-quinone oxidoreductase subunit C [Candidatus Binatia bacterium]
MTDFSGLRSALAERLKGGAVNLQVRRGNELHFQISREDILDLAEFLRSHYGAELMLMVANACRANEGAFELHYLFANNQENWFVHATAGLPSADSTIPSLATFTYPASRFEREIKDLFGIEATGHPDRRPLVRHAFWPEDYFPLRGRSALPEKFEDDGTPFPFLPVEGEGVYEIPVGPVHAGIIEPGHFRFSVVGETVIDLKIRLYFTHKGTEKLFEGQAPADGVELAERISGDTTIGHSLAYCQALEALAGVEVPARAQYVRVVLLEMERLYNHVADFGMICNDTGFAVAHSHCFRIRERLLRLNRRLTGNRLLRGGIVPGGIARPLPHDLNLPAELDSILADFNEVVEISLNNTMVMDRLEGTGQLTTKTATDLGALGYIARASGINGDARRDHPFAGYHQLKFKVPVFETGDVLARTMVRVEEARESVGLLKQAMAQVSSGPLAAPLGDLPAFEPAFGIVEGWRGAIVHWLMVDQKSKLFRVKVKDPSFANWPALSFALLNNIVPDFPLCNKSFNQSYSGNDL